MTGSELLPLLVTVLCALAVGGGLQAYGGARARSWAVPAGSAVLLGGLGHIYELPGWAVVGAFLVVPYFLHRAARRRLESAARSIDRLKVGDAVVLRRIPDPTGRCAALWTSVPEQPRAAVAALAGPQARPPLVVGLEFVGEGEDEYSVVLRAEVPGARPGVLFAHHLDAQVAPPAGLEGREPVQELPGMPAGVVVLAEPMDFALSLLDIPTLAALAGILSLRGGDREIYVLLNGPDLRVVSTEVYGAEELRVLLAAAARVFLKVESAWARRDE